MKIVLPTDTTHEITLIPRYYPTNSASLELYNETTKETIAFCHELPQKQPNNQRNSCVL